MIRRSKSNNSVKADHNKGDLSEIFKSSPLHTGSMVVWMLPSQELYTLSSIYPLQDCSHWYSLQPEIRSKKERASDENESWWTVDNRYETLRRVRLYIYIKINHMHKTGYGHVCVRVREKEKIPQVPSNRDFPWTKALKNKPLSDSENKLKTVSPIIIQIQWQLQKEK